MKRRLSKETQGRESSPRLRRQPQVSCDFCRSKKLKCDRGRPCFNCTTRGIRCDGYDVPVASKAVDQGPRPNADVLERLRRLEETVFGKSPASSAEAHGDSHQAAAGEADEALPTQLSTPLVDSAADLQYSAYHDLSVPDDSDTITYRVTSRRHIAARHITNTRNVDLPSKQDVHDLLQDYLNSSELNVASVVHSPSIKATIDSVYAQLPLGHKIDPASAALILSLCAACACFWDEDGTAKFDFGSKDNAALQCRAWRRAVWALLDQTHMSGAYSLDFVHASLIFAELMFNTEGATPRWRYLQSAMRAAAYELRLHLIDLPGNDLPDDHHLREMKRRIWWFLASTDWLMATMGGNADRVYTINPKHMRVNYPHHIQDSDPTVSSYGAQAENAVHHMQLRIRLAELSRDTVDALPLGAGDVDTLSFSKIAALDKRFEVILKDFPMLDGSNLPADASSRRIALQRAVGAVSIHARRARFLRPFVQIIALPEKFVVFQRHCLSAAQTVVDLVSTMLRETVATPESAEVDVQGGQRLGANLRLRRGAHDSGLIINHLFMACAVLATDPSLRGEPPESTSSGWNAETERKHAQLANACRLLDKAGEKSAVARVMVKRLVAVLRKHRVHGVEQDKAQESSGQDVRGRAGGEEVDPSAMMAPEALYAQRVGDDQHRFPGFVGQQGQVAGGDGVFGGVDPNALTGIWNDFLGMNPSTNGWEQLFTDLDYLGSGM